MNGLDYLRRRIEDKLERDEEDHQHACDAGYCNRPTCFYYEKDVSMNGLYYLRKQAINKELDKVQERRAANDELCIWDDDLEAYVRTSL